MDIIKAIEQEYMKDGVNKFEVGSDVKVYVKIKEGNKERIQIFEGTVIKRQNSGLNETFTVRKISNGVGVERTFPVNSPKIEKVEVTKNGKVKRAKLYYLRDRVGKATRVKEDISARSVKEEQE
jgi:large subunit ribosomal protein L19